MWPFVSASLAEQSVVKAHRRCRLGQSVLPFYGLTLVVTPRVSSLDHWWTFGLFLLFGCCEQCPEHFCTAVCVDVCCHLSWVCTWEQSRWVPRWLRVHFLRSRQTVCQGGCPSCIHHRVWRVPCPRPHHHLSLLSTAGGDPHFPGGLARTPPCRDCGSGETIVSPRSGRLDGGRAGGLGLAWRRQHRKLKLIPAGKCNGETV